MSGICPWCIVLQWQLTWYSSKPDAAGRPARVYEMYLDSYLIKYVVMISLMCSVYFALKIESCHGANFANPGDTEGCRYDNIRDH